MSVKYKLGIFVFIFLILAIACTNNDRIPLANTQKNTVNEDKDTTRYAVLEFNQYNDWMLENAKPAKISKEELQLLDSLLNIAVAEYQKSRRREKLCEPWETYKIQVLPLLVKNNKIAWVQCLAGSLVDDEIKNKWKHQMFSVDDGGDCIITVHINLTKKLVEKLYPNPLG